MDILQFFFAYILLFGLGLFVVLLSHMLPPIREFVDAMRTLVIKMMMTTIPDPLYKVLNKSIHHLLYTRNPLVQILSIFLMLLGNAVYIVEILPILYAFKPGECHILLTPIILLVLTLGPFYLSCVSDPGRISSSFEASVWNLVYKPDGVMFMEGNYCRTCKQLKPARSKHCNMCGYCVCRFDHHCLWTNNCVGGGNLRYFVLFLISLQMMVAHGIYRGTEALVLVAKHSGFLEGSLPLDESNGKHIPINFYYSLIENLFLHQPIGTLLVTSLILLFVLIGLLMFYHVMLILNNQTTNERYKVALLSQNTENGKVQGQEDNRAHKEDLNQNQVKSQAPLTIAQASMYSSKHSSNSKTNFSSRDSQNKTVKDLDMFYDRGFLVNVKEVLFPRLDYCAIKLKLKQHRKSPIPHGRNE